MEHRRAPNCPKCGERAREYSGMSMKATRDFKCPNCGKAFNQSAVR